MCSRCILWISEGDWSHFKYCFAQKCCSIALNFYLVHEVGRDSDNCYRPDNNDICLKKLGNNYNQEIHSRHS